MKKWIKKIVAGFTAAALMFGSGGLLPEGVFDALNVAVYAQGEEFEVDENGVLTQYNGDGGDVTIPDGVSTIGSKLFYNNSSITSIKIPEGVTRINDRAFWGCYNLREIIIPDTVSYIDDFAFVNCSNIESILIPDSVNYLGNYALYGCSKLINISLSDNIEFIGEYLFKNCNSLVEINIPNSVIEIRNDAFFDCHNLKTVTFPEKLKYIGDTAFSGCSKLENIILPNQLLKLGSMAFSRCSNLTELNIPDTVHTIGAMIGDGSYSLSKFTVADNNEVYKDIDGVLFDKAGKKLIQWPNGKNDDLYIVPNGVETICKGSMVDCLGPKEFIISDCVKTIENGAIGHADSIEKIYIGKNVSAIGDFTLFFGSAGISGCRSLKTIIVDKENPFFKDEYGVLFTKGGEILVNYPIGRQQTEYVIPDGVLLIHMHSFGYSENLKHVHIPDSVRAINNAAFFACTNLNGVILPDNIMLGHGAFEDCIFLESIVIGRGLGSAEYTLPESIFWGCTKLKDVYYKGAENDSIISIFSTPGITFHFNYELPVKQINITKSDSNYGRAKINQNIYFQDIPTICTPNQIENSELNVSLSVKEMNQLDGLDIPAKAHIGTYLKINLMKMVDGKETYIDETASPIEIKIELPEEIKNNVPFENKCVYQLLRLYNGVTDILATTYDGTYLTFSTDKFSDFAIAIVEQSVVGISITDPQKDEYFIGETLDLTGGKITVSYDYGDPAELALTDAMVSGFDSTTAGTKTITVTYEGFTDTFEVTVKAPSITGIVVTAPAKLEYYTGENIDVTGGKITVSYDYGNPVELDLTAAMLNKYDKTKVGKQTITVTYEGCTDTFEVEFVKPPKQVRSIAVVAPKILPKLYTGDELDLTGYELKVTFDDRSTENIPLTADMVSGYDPFKAAKQTLTAEYGGQTATFTVTVTALAAAKLEIAAQPTKTAYFLGEALDLTGGKLKVTYNNDKTEEIPMTAEGVTNKGFDSTKTGTKTVTVTYLGKSVTLKMTVAVDPKNAPVVVNGAGYENLAAALKEVTTGVLDITIRTSITEKNLTIPKTVTSATISTAPGAVLTLNTPTITANCDLTLDAVVEAEKASAKTFTVKATTDKKVTINRLETTLPITLSGTKTSDFVLKTGSVMNIVSAATINVEIAAGTTVKLDGGKFTPTMLSGSGKLDVYGAATITLADARNADITLNKYEKKSGKNITVNLQKLTVGTVGAVTLTVKEPDGTLSNISSQAVITLSKQDVIPNLENRIIIVNTANGKKLSAVQYKKEVRAEYLDALTLSDGTNEKNYSSFEKAFEAMTNMTANYTVKLNEDTALAKLTLPKQIGSLTIDGSGKTLTLTGVTSIAPRYGLTLKDINITAVNAKGAAAALTVNVTTGNAAIDGLNFNGKTLSIKGGKDNVLTLGECSEIYSLTGFAKVNITDDIAISKTFTANDVKLGASANLTLMNGAALKINKGKAITGDNGATITLIKGFTPIDLSGTLASNIKFVSATTLEDQPIFKTKADLSGVYDLSGIAPDNGLSYDLLTSGQYAYLKAYTIDVNGVKYAFWDDVVKAITSKTTDYTIKLLADVNIGAALKLPAASKCKSLTIDGNGHSLTFIGTSVSVSLPLTLKDITVTALNKKTLAETAWTLKTNNKLTEVGNVVLTQCTKK